jgi:hypothetical protein
MYRTKISTLVVSVTALVAVMPTLLVASQAKAGEIATLEGSVAPTAVLTAAPTAGVTDDVRVEALAMHSSSRGAKSVRSSPTRAMVQRQQFNRQVAHHINPQPRTASIVKPQGPRVAGGSPTAKPIAKPQGPHVAGGSPTAKPLGPIAKPQGTRPPMRMALPPGQLPTSNTTTRDLRDTIIQGRNAQARLDQAATQGLPMNPAVRAELQREAAQGRLAQQELNGRIADATKNRIPGNRPDDGGGDRRGNGDRDRGGDGRFSGGGGGGDAPVAEAPAPAAPAPSNAPAPSYAPAPGYSAPRYSPQPAAVAKDEPVCVHGTWAMQDNQKVYVCLSWHFRGQVYTPDQMEAVIAQLGIPRPALLGG